jgi:hypothetical protein
MSYGASLNVHYLGFNPPTNATVLRFGDSHTQPWAGALQISNWGLHPGDHIYFGTNSQALTSAQLAQIQFIGNDGKTSAAKLLVTGELVPAVPPPMSWTNSGKALVLSWPGGYQLTTSTNINGPYVPVPGVTSGYTNTFTEPRRYFRLQPPGP